MIERVVVPVSFTSADDRALAAATSLAARAGIYIELVTVAFPASRRDVEPRLAALAHRVGAGTTFRMIASAAPVADALRSEFRGAEHELWCVGSNVHGALAEVLVGSVSEQLVRGSHAPIVIAGPHVTNRPSADVLAVALDGNDASEAILPDATRVASSLGLTLCLLQVLRAEGIDPSIDAAETSTMIRVARGVRSLTPQGVDFDVIHGGHPAHSLAKYVEAQPSVAMIAAATRGHPARHRLVQPSTALELAHQAVVPVMLLALGTSEPTSDLPSDGSSVPSPRRSGIVP